MIKDKNNPPNTAIINKEILEETLGFIYESVEIGVEHIEGLTNALRIIYEEEKKPKTYGNEIAIQAIIDSINDTAYNTLFEGTWDAERHFQYISHAYLISDMYIFAQRQL